MIEKVLKIRLNYMVDYVKCHKKRTLNPISLSNLNPPTVGKTHKFSLQIQRKMKEKCELFLLAIFMRRIENTRLHKKQNCIATFITLTYPTENSLPATHCHREHLNHFLISLKRMGNRNYIWRAELQKNGNLHYHIFGDTYVDKKRLQTVWNNIIEGDNFITNFAAKHHHRNPPTTRIDAVNDILKATSYISKYMTKTSHQSSQLIGKFWGLSDSLKNIKSYEETGYDRDETVNSVLNSQDFKEVIKINDFCSIITLNSNAYKTMFHISVPHRVAFEKHHINNATLINL